jgi:radical SAM protein with 4Fe4S-binding SPASM domain
MTLGEPDERHFLAVSTQAATYVALPVAYLPAFMLLRDGHTPNDVGQRMAGQCTKGQWRAFLGQFFKVIVLRNMRPDACIKEDLPVQSTLHLYVTNRCNLRCTHCYMSSGKPLPQGEMTNAERKRAIDTFTAMGGKGKISFSGGEALASPDIYDLMAYGKSLGHEIELYTNGLLVGEGTVQHLVDTVDHLQISLDGTTAEVNDPIRGQGSFSKILSAIHLVDRADRSRNPSFVYRIGLTMTATNCDDIEENVVSFLSSLDLQNPHKIHVGVVGRIGRAKSNTELTAGINDLPAVQARVLSRFVSQGRIKWPNFTVNLHTKTCGIGMSVTVAADGKIYPCSITDQPALGHVGDADALAAMQSVSRLTDSTNVDRVMGCKTCSLRYACHGQCRVSNYHQTGTMLETRCSPSFKAARVESLIAGFGSFLA